MKEDNDNNNENRVTTETLFSDVKETEIRNGKEYIQIEDSYVDGDRVYINPKTGKKIVYIDGLSPIMLEVGTAIVKGYLDIMQDNYGFLRDKTLRNTKNDVYVSQTMIKLFGLAIGDSVLGITREAEEGKYPALIYVVHINDKTVSKAFRSKKFDSLIPMYPLEKLEIDKGDTLSNIIISLISTIVKGQRALIVSPPKAGKTTMLKEIATSLKENCKSAELMVLLIDERPEEVTDIEDTIGGYVISSTFDQKPEDHIHIAEFALEIAKRKVENGKDVVVLLDSITRLARAYNLTVPSSGKLLSGGFDPNALYRPKKFFGAARNTKEAGSLTIIATALVDTGSRLDDVVYEEFKGTGNMELHLDRNIAEMRIFPAINVKKSSTRKDELLYGAEEKKKIDKLRTKISGLTDVEATKTIISLLKKTKTNDELIEKL